MEESISKQYTRIIPEASGLNAACWCCKGIKGTSTMEMTGGTITGNSAEYGGILVGTYSTKLHKCRNNFSDPAHYYSKGILNLKGGTISNNTAAVFRWWYCGKWYRNINNGWWNNQW